MNSVKTFAWLTLLLPLAGTLVNALGYKIFKGKTPGYIGTLFLAASFGCAIAMLSALLGLHEEERQVRAVAWDYAVLGGDGAKSTVDVQLTLSVRYCTCEATHSAAAGIGPQKSRFSTIITSSSRCASSLSATRRVRPPRSGGAP